MAKKKKKRRLPNITNIFTELREETVQGIWAVTFFVFALFLVLASFDLAGVVGETVFNIFTTLLGVGYYLMPILLFSLSIYFFKSLDQKFGIAKIVGSVILFLSGLGIIDLLLKKGGLIGGAISSPLLKLFEFYTSLLILLALLIIAIIITFDAHLSMHSLGFLKKIFNKKEKNVEEEDWLDEEEEEEEEEDDEEEEENDEEEEEEGEDEEEEEEESSGIKKLFEFGGKKGSKLVPVSAPHQQKPYSPPPLSLLENDKGKPGVGDIKANANLIKRTMLNFGIQVEMDEVSIGPAVTRYSLKPAEGVRLSKIVGLQNNLELALAAHPVRIEAPIPGKSLVGIEVPNTSKATVGLASLLSSPECTSSEKPLLVALGKDISGKSHLSDLAKMPHLLIAGATGAGKSVSIHAIITSLLFRNSPENLRLIMIDPKRVELTLYNNIPHLLTPVITDAKKTILALKWAAKEMDRRYDILETESVRDISSYHKNIVEPAYQNTESTEEGAELPEKMPYIVIVIDELADIMQMYPRELESAVVRLAQMSRAVGIHLILSTQRPSVNIITGLIKANIPARIALQVSSQIDSRTILDTGGAEKLLGAGDMLYLSGEMSKPHRIQAAFLTEAEVKKVVKHLTKAYEDELPDEIDITNTPGDPSAFESSFDDEDGVEDDELYEEAKEIIIAAGKASTSYLQRKLRIGYARAARLMDILEDRGVIGPADGSKPREVLEEYSNSDEDEYDEGSEEEEEGDEETR